MTRKRVLAFDYGASSGRAILGEYDGNSISLKEVHRFTNDPVSLNGTLYWDFLRLIHEMKNGMIKAKTDGGFDSLAVDTWGVDFGLLDIRGNLLENPVHYRDKRTAGMLKRCFARIDKDELYQITGIQFMELNTIFQLAALMEQRPELIERTDKLLLMPDLFNFFLTGKKCAEYSIASTTQMLDAAKGDWSPEVLKILRIPVRILPPIMPAGTMVGKVIPAVCNELGLYHAPEVIAVTGHDTQCAMAAVPTDAEDFIFISCGTWSLFGTELEEPIISEASYRLNMTNEGGYQRKISFLKNIIGLWLIQESRRQWAREGREYSFGELEQMAQQTEPFRCFIDPDAPEFIPGGNLPRRIREYCQKTGQYIPRTEGEIIRCINESLALKYAWTKEEIETCTGKQYSVIHMIGGGTRSQMLCQMTAEACGCKVVAGPVEATVYGNIVLQLLTTGEISDLKAARKIISASEPLRTFQTAAGDNWQKAYMEYRRIIG